MAGVGAFAFSGFLGYGLWGASEVTSGRSCPSFNDDVAETVCVPGDDRIHLEVRVSNGETPSASISSQNRSDDPFVLNPAGWQLYRVENGKWSALGPEITFRGSFTLEPGRTYRYIFDQSRSTDSNEFTAVVNDVPLREGRYAFATLVRRKQQREAPPKPFEIVAPFDI